LSSVGQKCDCFDRFLSGPEARQKTRSVGWPNVTDRVGYIAGTIILLLKSRLEANLRHDLAEDRT
jgi:hypothetical protein